MIQVKLNPSTQTQLSDFDFKLLEEIPKRNFTDWLDLPEDKDKTVEMIKIFIQERGSIRNASSIQKVLNDSDHEAKAEPNQEGTWDKIIVLGIGGSSLGIITLYKALFPFDDRLTVIDNLDSTTINHELSTLNPERTLIIVISKSGGTLETMTNMEIFKEKFTEEQYQKNFIILTDPQEGKLRELATTDQLTTFPIPPRVGGRFSVLSSVGLLPLALLGGDIDQLLAGAKEMKERCLEKSENNPALQLASAAYNLSLPNTPDTPPKTINTLISYSDQLYPFTHWYQQLLAESIGKTPEIGLTPLPLRGASDQHSVLQLLQDGPNDKLNIFLEVQNSKLKIQSKFKTQNSKLSIHEILRIELKATEQALRESNRPTLIIEIPEINEDNLGQLFMLFQIQIAILGELYEINAYDQPGVEKSKKIVKELLKG